jgi:hypothetical protein
MLDIRHGNKTVTMITSFVYTGIAVMIYAPALQYINIDDGWASHRLPNGTIVANVEKFPNGLQPVIDYVHSHGGLSVAFVLTYWGPAIYHCDVNYIALHPAGLMFGIYTAYTAKTCQGLPGSNGFKTIDANTYAGWGVDYLKVGADFVSVGNTVGYCRMKACQTGR